MIDLQCLSEQLVISEQLQYDSRVARQNEYIVGYKNDEIILIETRSPSNKLLAISIIDKNP